MDKNKSLRPCPFCGGTEIEIYYCSEDCCGGQPVMVDCSCGCTLNVNVISDKEAIKQWNKRVT